ncbi:hypothetical protein EMPG_15314 [Blastomyces silverae]|uniref:Uncharacterized protein n=1 Tax=Blastomyces silverae TaxID=2060906 RepID=A0A0H1BE59_9EURO|nr:hypothetical protein EMPG_15314 [Blastomyces silverae]
MRNYARLRLSWPTFLIYLIPEQPKEQPSKLKTPHQRTTTQTSATKQPSTPSKPKKKRRRKNLSVSIPPKSPRKPTSVTLLAVMQAAIQTCHTARD